MSKPFTGRHMTAILVGGFAVVIGVNLVMARAAISTFGGLVVDNSYVASQHFNNWLEKADEAKALGWKVDLSRTPDGRIQVAAADVPAGATVRGEAWHPLGRMPDRELRFVPAGAGSYASDDSLPAGRWVIRLEIASGKDVWRGEQDLR